jgi:prevent-host-death family protein
MVRRSSARVGVRELRQNLSVYLRRVADGETLQVTEHGRPVAILAPCVAATTALDRALRVARGAPGTRQQRRGTRRKCGARYDGSRCPQTPCGARRSS